MGEQPVDQVLIGAGRVQGVPARRAPVHEAGPLPLAHTANRGGGTGTGRRLRREDRQRVLVHREVHLRAHRGATGVHLEAARGGAAEGEAPGGSAADVASRTEKPAAFVIKVSPDRSYY